MTDAGGDPRDPGAPRSAPRDARPASPPSPPPVVEPPSPDVESAGDSTPLPGAHRGGFQRLPTAPLDVTTEVAPAEPGSPQPEVVAQWRMPQDDPSRGVAGWALGFAILGLAVSLVVGWGFPLGLVAIVMGIVALRRPLERRGVSVWAIVLGGVSIVYSAGWLWWATTQPGLFV